MRFADAMMLWLLLLVPLLALVGLWVASRRRRSLERFAGGPERAGRFRDEVSAHGRAVKWLLLLLGVAHLVFALARPQWGSRLEPVRQEGADLVVVVDTSLSMAAEDLAPSRLAHAQHAIGALAGSLVGHRVGLVSFAGRATLACPLTADRAAFRLFLDALDVTSVAVPGTALADALETAVRAFEERSPEGRERGRAIVLFSDGEDHEGALDEAIAALEDQGIAVYAVGTGTVRGAPIPLRDATGTLTGYKKNREEQVVTTRLDETTLERIALDSGGRYYRATVGELEVEEIARALSGLETGETGALLRTRYEERFQLPLLVAWAALLGELLLGDRRRGVRRAAAGQREAA